MGNGARTRNAQGHNLVLCQLSYTHRQQSFNLDDGAAGSRKNATDGLYRRILKPFAMRFCAMKNEWDAPSGHSLTYENFGD